MRKNTPYLKEMLMAVPAYYAYQDMGAVLSFKEIHYAIFPFMSITATTGSIIVVAGIIFIHFNRK